MNRPLTQTEQILLDKTGAYVESVMKNETTGHDFHHVRRVVGMTKKLLESVSGVDPFISLMSAYLHDLDDPKLQADKTCLAQDYLNSTNIDSAVSDRIMDIIKNMSFSAHKAGRKVASMEGMVVQDADRLDALGAIGIARCFAYGGRKSRSIYRGDKDDDSSLAHFYQKLLNLEELMNLPEAKRIAKARTGYLKVFLDTFLAEWDLENR